jgi:hypothetical protein
MEPTMGAGAEPGSEMKVVGSVVQIDEGRIQAHLDEVVRSTVEETLNALLDAEADQLCGAHRYERSEGRKDTRAPQLRAAVTDQGRRSQPEDAEAAQPAIRDRDHRALPAVGVFITQALWGTRVSASTVSDLNQKIYMQIEEWRQQPLVGEFPYVFLDGLWLKRSWGGEVKNVSVLVAIGVAQTGYRKSPGLVWSGRRTSNERDHTIGESALRANSACWMRSSRKHRQRGRYPGQPDLPKARDSGKSGPAQTPPEALSELSRHGPASR